MNALLDAHLLQYVKANSLRSEREITRCFKKYVRPNVGKLTLVELRRGHIVEMLDKVTAENGPVMADRVLAHFRKTLNWHAARDETFSVPVVRGMAQTIFRERTRDRTLADDEIRALWKATDAPISGGFATLVRVLLLTAQRREEVGGMRWEEIEGDTWIIPAARAKDRQA